MKPCLALAIATTVGLFAGRAHSDALVDEWFELWSRCRTAIEQVKPINTDGFVPKEIRQAGWARYRDWVRPGGRLMIVEKEIEYKPGTRRTCLVYTTDAEAGLSPDEWNRISDAFKRQRDQMVDSGKYKRFDEFSDGTTSFMTLTARTRNTSGCEISTGIWFYDVGASFFSNYAGNEFYSNWVELPSRKCSSASFIDAE